MKTIGISDCAKFKNYEDWILQEGNDIKVINLSYQKNNLHEAALCDGILLSGGEDVHPRFYHKPEYLQKLNPAMINEQRDEFELSLIDFCIKHHKPLLGICRGLQICNVYFGGTLVYDIPATGKPDHSSVKGSDRIHQVSIMPGSGLQKILLAAKGTINSSHHQAADKIGRGLKINAVSDDDIIEGLELEDAGSYPFFMLVQWHPERMPFTDNTFSDQLKNKFLESCR